MSIEPALSSNNKLYFYMPHDDYIENGHIYAEDFYGIAKAYRIIWWVDILGEDGEVLDAVPFASCNKAAKYLDDCIRFGYHGKYGAFVCTCDDPLGPDSKNTAYQLCIETTPYNTRLHSSEKEEGKT